MYVIKRIDQNRGYVANPGSKNTYTNTLEKARLFKTEEEALADRCPENERVVSVANILYKNI